MKFQPERETARDICSKYRCSGFLEEEQNGRQRLGFRHAKPEGEISMRRTLLVAIAAFTLASPLAALAQGVGVQVGPVGAGITFAPEQRTHIREYVTRERVAPVRVKERLAVGTRLPADVELRTVPADWGPSVTKYRYVYSNDRVYFVEPSTREVVYEVD
jgi:hypothetical protein